MNSMKTVQSTIRPLLSHSSVFARRILWLKNIQINVSVLKEIPKLIDSVDDLAIVLIPILIAKPLFHFEYTSLFKLFTRASKEKLLLDDNKNVDLIDEKLSQLKATKDKSFLGYIRTPLLFATRFPLFFYVLDVFSLLLFSLGIETHIKGGLADLISKLLMCLLAGSFATRIKDYFFQQILRKNEISKIDPIREATLDELTSIFIWAIVVVIGVELLSLKTGVALGSIFAVGGAGTASIILALRSTFENIIGGLLLKLQDKFRVNEIISIPAGASGTSKSLKIDEECRVEEIGYVFSRLRKTDNSLLVVPNHTFTQGEIVNWSRTPYRQFKTNIIVTVGNLKQLNQLINSIKLKLSQLNKIETIKRDLIVAATGFKDSKVVIDIETHISSTNEIECSEMKTTIIDTINSCIIDMYNPDKEEKTKINKENSPTTATSATTANIAITNTANNSNNNAVMTK